MWVRPNRYYTGQAWWRIYHKRKNQWFIGNFHYVKFRNKVTVCLTNPLQSTESITNRMAERAIKTGEYGG